MMGTNMDRCGNRQKQNEVKYKFKSRRSPYCCPVCSGRGIVPSGFYTFKSGGILTTNPETCRTCNGAGIIWGD